ncbi:MAG: GDSL-type esterase/lipase family protein [Anaerolineales bacterium]
MTRRQIAILVILLGANLLVGYGVVRLLMSRDNRQEPAPVPTAENTSSPELTSTPMSPTPSPAPSPTNTPRPDIPYQVQEGDTLWDVAERFGISLEVLLAANPELNAAALLYPGDEIIIPSPDEIFTAAATPAWPATGQVRLAYGGLPLRELPGEGAAVLFHLSALTPVTLVGRTANYAWLQVATQYGDRGWVPADAIEAYIDMDQIPVLTSVVVTPVPTRQGPEPTQASPQQYPYVSGLNESLLDVFERGQALGNRADVFSKVGDSITVSGVFLYPIGTDRYNLGEYAYLQPVIDYYSKTYALTNNSFANYTLAAKEGWGAKIVLTDGLGDDRYCSDYESPLECEYRLVKPSLALIMLGTNDVPGVSLENYEDSMRKIIQYSLDRGIIPIISTIPPMHRDTVSWRVSDFNDLIKNLAAEYQVPLWDFWTAIVNLPNQGMWSDGVHPSPAPAGHNADFQPDYLIYGYTVRNLTALQALDAVWRYLGLDQPSP